MTTAALPEVAAAERMRRLDRSLWESEGFSEAVAELAAGCPATFDGAWGSSCALLAAALAKGIAGDSSLRSNTEYVVVVLPTQREADELPPIWSSSPRSGHCSTQPGSVIPMSRSFRKRALANACGRSSGCWQSVEMAKGHSFSSLPYRPCFNPPPSGLRSKPPLASWLSASRLKSSRSCGG